MLTIEVLIEYPDPMDNCLPPQIYIREWREVEMSFIDSIAPYSATSLYAHRYDAVIGDDYFVFFLDNKLDCKYHSVRIIKFTKGGYCAYDPTIDIEKLEYCINLLRLHED